jgi:16S rRNA (guanine527-N7)-methyltransferase
MERLVAGARRFGISLTPQHLDAFRAYFQELVVWNERFNLTAITDWEQVQVRHFLDSLSCLLADEVRTTLEQGAVRAVDIGSGAGFPGLPLKLLYPHADMTLLEATGKKVSFLEHLVERLGLQRVYPVHARAEELGRQDGHRERYDLALVRAVASMPVVAEYGLPLCRVGGWLVAQKGEAGAAEAWAAEPAFGRLGGKLHRVLPVEVPGLAEDRSLVIVRKMSPTPVDYPRRPGRPAKRPLT